MYDKKSLGKRIKEVRKSKGFTQERLSEIVGIDAKHLSRIECGINSPSLDLLNKISSALDVETYILFQTNQYRPKTELIQDINNILKSSPEDKIRTYYKVLLDIVS